MSDIKETRVQWTIRGSVYCPNCEHEFDFMDVDEFYTWSEPGQYVETFFRPVEYDCHNCGNKFNVTGADY